MLLNSQKDSTWVLRVLRNICRVTSRVDLFGCQYSSLQMGASRCRSSQVSPLMPSRKHCRFSGISLGIVQEVSDRLTALWMSWCMAALSCSAISSVQEGVVAVSWLGVGVWLAW